MNKYYWPFSYWPSGRADALLVANYHARHEFGVSEGHEFEKRVAQYMRVAEMTRKELVKLAAESDQERARKQTYEIFQQRPCLLTAVLFASYHKRDSRPDIPDALTAVEAYDWANLCGRLQNQQEPIDPKKITSPDGSVRQTWKFGPVRYAQQLLVSWILLAQRTLPKFDYFAASGDPWEKSRKGIHGAASSIGNAMQKGFRYWATSDIRNAYSSIGRPPVKHLYSLDERVTRYVVCPTMPCSSYSDALSHQCTTNQKASQPQLPQGSAHAWIILSALIGGILQGTILGEKTLWCVVFADNIAIGAQDIDSARWALQTLETELFAFPKSNRAAAGKLILHDKTICDGFVKKDYNHSVHSGGITFQNSVDFCGYRIRRDLGDNEVHFSPSGKSWKRFWSNVRQDWLEDFADFDACLQLAMSRYDSWSKQFPLWRHANVNRMIVETQACEQHDKLLLEMA